MLFSLLYIPAKALPSPEQIHMAGCNAGPLGHTGKGIFRHPDL